MDNGAKATENIAKMANPENNGLANFNRAVDGGRKAIETAGNIVTTVNGAFILSIGLSLGFGMWIMGINCSPKCTNPNADLVRLGAIALSSAGLAVIGFSGLKSVFSK